MVIKIPNTITNIYTAKSEFVNLYVNGDFQGLYLLTEKLKENRLIHYLILNLNKIIQNFLIKISYVCLPDISKVIEDANEKNSLICIDPFLCHVRDQILLFPGK